VIVIAVFFSAFEISAVWVGAVLVFAAWDVWLV
jgi:hypothetical protein